MNAEWLRQSGYALHDRHAVWMRPDYPGIDYNDGDAVEDRIAGVIRRAVDRSVLSTELRRGIGDWPSLYHLSPSRANLLRPFADRWRPGCRILEIGSGCGALTRFLGESGARVLALEGSPRRAAITRLRTADLENVSVMAETFDRLPEGLSFDAITLVGVLEYANRFVAGDAPPLDMLRRIASLLQPDGVLIVAVENRFGLKYFAGAPEDHLGGPMAGIEGRYRSDGPQTFGRVDLQTMLRRAGFKATAFLAPFPDYKFPASILTEVGMADPEFDAAALAWQNVRRDPQLPEYCCFAQELVWPGLFANRMAMDLSNSFLIAARLHPGTLLEPGLLACHYSTGRIPEFCREAVFRRCDDDRIRIAYRRLGSETPTPATGPKPPIRYVCPDSAGYVTGQLLVLEFIRIVSRDGWTFEEVGGFLRRYLDLVVDLEPSSRLSGDVLKANDILPGKYFDFTPQNIVVRPDGSTDIIDMEWQLDAPLEVGYLLYRSVLRLVLSVTRFGPPADHGVLTWGRFFNAVTVAAGVPLSDHQLQRYRSFEASVQRSISGRSGYDLPADWLRRRLPVSHIEQALKHRDARIAELEARLDESSQHLDYALLRAESVEKSLSWRAMAPVRKMLNLGHASLRSLLPNRLRQCRSEDSPDSTANLTALRNLAARRTDRSALSTARPAAQPAEWPDIDLTVVSYNSTDWIKPFLESLRSQNYPLSKIHLFIVDHNSQDDSARLWQNALADHGHEFATTRFISQPNLGFGAGHDRAIRGGRSDYCLVSNLDLEFMPDSICTAVLTALNDPDGTVASWEMRQIPYEHPKYYDPVTLETNWSSHACVLVRRRAYETVGGYDPAFFMYAEDVELSYRFRSHGYALKYVPRAVVRHHAYPDPGVCKPLQHGGSLLGNCLVRLRYGRMRDRLAGLARYCSRIVVQPPLARTRQRAVLDLIAFLKRSRTMRRGRAAVKAAFPLRGIDYELSRQGAFLDVEGESAVNPLVGVTIITRTFRGRGAFLEQAARCVFNQTYSAIEWIVAEDGGQSQSARVAALASEAPNGCRVRYLPQPASGRSATGNAGLAAATGALIMFLDDDDLLFADHVETLVQALDRDPTAYAAYALAMEVQVVQQPAGCPPVEQSFETPAILMQPWRYEVLLDHNFIPIQALLFKRELFENRGGFDTKLDQLEDWNLWLRYGHDCRFIYVPKTTSIFHSPADPAERLIRHHRLHDAYAMARERARDDIPQRNEPGLDI